MMAQLMVVSAQSALMDSSSILMMVSVMHAIALSLKIYIAKIAHLLMGHLLALNAKPALMICSSLIVLMDYAPHV